MASVSRSVRASYEEWERWRACAVARGFNLNSWLRKIAGSECDRVEAEVRRIEASQLERDVLRRAKDGF